MVHFSPVELIEDLVHEHVRLRGAPVVLLGVNELRMLLQVGGDFVLRARVLEAVSVDLYVRRRADDQRSVDVRAGA